MRWQVSHRFDPVAARVADRHYNRHTPGSPQFAPPGRCVVLRTPAGDAVWVTSWQAYVLHQWGSVWVNSLFRNEAPDKHLSSELVREAVAATLAVWPSPPTVEAEGYEVAMLTFIDRRKIRRKRDPGRCYRRAGFEEVGETKDVKLLVLGLPVDRLPDPAPALGTQEALAVV